jgi:hypothetical protein
MSRLLWRCQMISTTIGVWTFIQLRILKRVAIFFGRNIQLDLSRFHKASKLHFSSSTDRASNFAVKKVGLSIVASDKDFDLLGLSIPCGINALGGNYGGEIQIVVPENKVQLCQEKVADLGYNELVVISENSLLGETHRNLLRNKFGSRYGWALQQFLKVAQVLQSNLDATLVLDADTILVHERRWFDDRNRQILFPSWEFNEPYYKLLSGLGIGTENPEFTFVTHHMLMQKQLMLEAITMLKVRNVSGLVELVSQRASNEHSSFCIEYELYGQYLFNFRPEIFFLEKWSNKSVLRQELNQLSPGEIRVRYRDFASISAHDYLKK